jgi:hypothetical protein
MRHDIYVNFPVNKCNRLFEIRLNKGGTTSSKPVLPESNGVYPFSLSLQICTSVPQSNTPSHCIDFADLFEQGFFIARGIICPFSYSYAYVDLYKSSVLTNIGSDSQCSGSVNMYLLRIRIWGARYLNCGSGLGRPINYGSGRIRILSGNFCCR